MNIFRVELYTKVIYNKNKIYFSALHFKLIFCWYVYKSRKVVPGDGLRDIMLFFRAYRDSFVNDTLVYSNKRVTNIKTDQNSNNEIEQEY